MDSLELLTKEELCLLARHLHAMIVLHGIERDRQAINHEMWLYERLQSYGPAELAEIKAKHAKVKARMQAAASLWRDFEAGKTAFPDLRQVFPHPQPPLEANHQ